MTCVALIAAPRGLANAGFLSGGDSVRANRLSDLLAIRASVLSVWRVYGE